MPKPFITYQQQIALLKSKHLTVPDEKEAERILADIGYFTLIGWYKHGSLVGIIGAWTQTSYVDFCLQLLVDFFLGHGKNSFILLFRICGIPSIREFMV